MEQSVSEERLAKAKTYAYRLLSYRSRSCRELRERLRRKRFSKKIIDRIVKDLEELNFVNDREFSKTFVETRSSTNPCGRRLIEQELRKKGIDEEIIRDICEEAFNRDKEYELASSLALRRLSRYKNIDERTKWKRLYGHLARRGFPLETVREVLSGILGSNE